MDSFLTLFPFILLLCLCHGIVHSQQVQTFGQMYSINVNQTVSYLAYKSSAIQLTFNTNTTLSGSYTLESLPTEAYQGLSMPKNSQLPLTLLGVYNFNLSQIVNTAQQVPPLHNTVNMLFNTSSAARLQYNFDPYSFRIFRYHPMSNFTQIFQDVPSTGLWNMPIDITNMMAYNETFFTFGLFAYTQIQNPSFSQTVTIAYPQTVAYTINSEQSLSLTYSNAAVYSPTAASKPTFYLLKLSSSLSTVNGYVLLHVFSYTETATLNSLGTTRVFSFNSSGIFRNQVGSVVNIDPSTLRCMYLADMSFSYIVENTRPVGNTLTCSKYVGGDYTMYIVASPPAAYSSKRPPVASSSSLSSVNTLVSGSIVTKTLAAEERARYKIVVPAQRLLTVSLSSNYLASVLIRIGYMPTFAYYDSIFFADGTRYVSNLKSYNQTVYLMVDGSVSRSSSFTLKTTISGLPSVDFATIGAIVGGVIGFCVCVGCIVFVLVFVLISRKKRAQQLANQQGLSEEFVPQQQTSQYYRVN